MNPVEFFPISSVSSAPSKPPGKSSVPRSQYPTRETDPIPEQEKIVLQTTHLYITFFNPAIPSHPSLLVKLWNEPHVTKIDGPSAVQTIADAQAVIRRSFLPEYSRNGYSVFVLLLKPTPDTPADACEPIGTASLRKGDQPESFAVPDVGFAVLASMTGQGYATEAGRALVDWARLELGLPGVLGFAAPENVASRRVLVKIGLRDRGLHRLAPFGGAVEHVYALPEMEQDLNVYNLLDA